MSGGPTREGVFSAKQQPVSCSSNEPPLVSTTHIADHLPARRWGSRRGGIAMMLRLVTVASAQLSQPDADGLVPGVQFGKEAFLALGECFDEAPRLRSAIRVGD